MRWVPLESNPDVLNEYLKNLGISKGLKLEDVYDLDEKHLAEFVKPVVAVILLLPRTEAEKLESFGKQSENGKLFLIHQSTENACGTVAILHALLNNYSHIKPDDDSFIAKFHSKTQSMNPEERGRFIDSDQHLAEMHEKCAHKGQTKAPNRESESEQHFVCFVQHDDELFELDGRKSKPISHGKSSANSLLRDTCEVVKKFCARDPANHNFSLLALTCC